MPDYHGISGTGTPGGIIPVPENIPHYYDTDGVLKVVAVGYDSAGNIHTDEPAPENRAEYYHKAIPYTGPAGPGPAFTQVVWDPFKPGYRMDPKTDPGGPHWIERLDATGDPVYGEPPASTGSDIGKALALVALGNLAAYVRGKK
jgi:hypothetical protein